MEFINQFIEQPQLFITLLLILVWVVFVFSCDADGENLYLVGVKSFSLLGIIFYACSNTELDVMAVPFVTFSIAGCIVFIAFLIFVIETICGIYKFFNNLYISYKK